MPAIIPPGISGNRRRSPWFICRSGARRSFRSFPCSSPLTRARSRKRRLLRPPAHSAVRAAPAERAPGAVAPPIPTASVVRADPGAQNGPAQLSWTDPPQVRLGARFDVALKVTSGQPVHASPMQLRFDPAQLELVTVKPGKFFGGGTPVFSNAPVRTARSSSAHPAGTPCRRRTPSCSF